MKLSDYIKTQDVSGGFPEGDTYLNLDECDFQESTFTDRTTNVKTPRTKINTNDGREFYCAKSVLKDLAALQEKGVKNVRVTRSGKGKENTRYTVVEVKA